MVGASKAMPKTQAIGIDIGAKPDRVRTDTFTHAKGASGLLGIDVARADVEVVPWHEKPHYGLPHQATLEAIGIADSLEELMLDPVHSGKGPAGLIALVKSGRWRKDSDVVFIHSGVLSSHASNPSNVDAAT